MVNWTDGTMYYHMGHMLKRGRHGLVVKNEASSMPLHPPCYIPFHPLDSRRLYNSDLPTVPSQVRQCGNKTFSHRGNTPQANGPFSTLAMKWSFILSFVVFMNVTKISRIETFLCAAKVSKHGKLNDESTKDNSSE